MNRTVALALFAIIFSASSPAHSEPASKESVLHLMELSGAGRMGVQMMEQMLPSMKQLTPDAEPRFWDDFMSEVDPDELVNMVAPVYQKYLTAEDVEAITAFYNSPAGRKLVQVQPNIMQESMLAGQQWGRSLAQRVITKYRAEKRAAQQR